MPAPLNPSGSKIGYDGSNNPILFGQYPILDLLVKYAGVATGSLVDQVIFQCPVGQAYQLTAAGLIYAVAGTDGGAVSLQLRKDTGVQAPAAGTALLTNNTNTGFNLKATANTTQAGLLVATQASLQLAAGDRLSVDFTGVTTALAGLFLTAVLKRINP